MGICGLQHPFAGRTVSLEAVFGETLVVREKGSGTRSLMQQALLDRGYSLERFRRCLSISNFSVICEVVAKNGAITFAYEPIANSREDLETFTVEGMDIQGEFNFVYTNSKIGKEKVAAFMNTQHTR